MKFSKISVELFNYGKLCTLIVIVI